MRNKTETESENTIYLSDRYPNEARIDDLMQRLTLDEKFLLLSGKNYKSSNGVRRLKIRPIKMADGPIGITLHSSLRKNTRFPCTKALAATWNRNLSRQMGLALAEEARALGFHVILAPGINLDRSPLNGRTFECYSEDPCLTRELAVPYIKAIQSKRIGACLKHFAMYNQETRRNWANVIADKRTRHELYLRAFEGVIREADPWLVMTAYNKLNGKSCCENSELLDKILLSQWNYQGLIISDWYAMQYSQNTLESLQAGLALEMPKPVKYKTGVLKALYVSGLLPIKLLDNLVRRILRTMLLTGVLDNPRYLPGGSRNTRAHQELTLHIAEQGIVLLKNSNSLLPLDITKIRKLAVLGPNANKRFGRLLYGGSSAVKPPFEITPLRGIRERVKNKIKITKNPKGADVVLIFAGLNHDSGRHPLALPFGKNNRDQVFTGNDSEGVDKATLDLPGTQAALIKKTLEENAKVVVILINGSPVAMREWVDKVPAIVEAWYGGMNSGRAIARVLFGDTVPSGKLPITFPAKLEDSPAHTSTLTFPGDPSTGEVHYEEGVYTGYRYFERENEEPLFPFGFGLSYTTFQYRNCILDNRVIKTLDDVLSVNVEVENTGRYAALETVQVYSCFHIPREGILKQLVGFEKILIQEGEKQLVHLQIKARDMAYYNTDKDGWWLDEGDGELHIGSSSKHIYFKEKITVILKQCV